MTPLASHGSAQSSSSQSTANTNTSRSVSMTLFDSNGNELPLLLPSNTTDKIDIRIPRDPSIALPSMSYENVTSLNINNTAHRLIFNLHFINITSHLPISLHLEMRPMNASRSYLFIYRFDQSPQLNTSIQIIDGWTLFCSSSETFFSQISRSIQFRFLSPSFSVCRCEWWWSSSILSWQSTNSQSSSMDLRFARTEWHRRWATLSHKSIDVYHVIADQWWCFSFHIELSTTCVHIRMLFHRWQRTVESRWTHREWLIYIFVLVLWMFMF